MNEKQANQNQEGWGLEKLAYPEGVGYISARWDLCVGCGHCEVACSMYHYGEINRELSRIRIYRYTLPLPKSVQNVCSQCSERERECQKACPVDPPVIHYDEERKHMVVNEEDCRIKIFPWYAIYVKRTASDGLSALKSVRPRPWNM